MILDLDQGASEMAAQVIGHPGTATEFAAAIAARWRDSLDALLDVGRLLIEAKAKLRHGEFGAMCANQLPFSQRTAQALMAICRDQRISNPANRQFLPPSWGTLYEITKLTDVEYKKAIEAKIIRADTERWELDGFRRAQVKDQPAATTDIAWTPRFPSPDIRRWTVAQLRLNARILRRVLDHAVNASDLDTVDSLISDQLLKKIWDEMK